MRQTHIRRYGRRQSNTLQWGCGCALLGGFMALLAFLALYLFLPLLPGMALQLSGANRIGTTGTLFEDVTVPPTAVVQNATSPQQVTVNLGQYGRESITVDQQHYAFVTGSSDSGTRIARASFTEAGLLAICAQQSPICREGSSQYRNVVLDLRPGGAVIYADVNTGGLGWQRVGVVLQLDSSRTLLRVAGIDISGALYDHTALPGELAGAVDEIVHVINDVLRQLAVEAGGENYTLSEIIIDDTTLTLLLR
ncbi:MAG TPA: hypothetical protein VKY59_20105 [Spirillospora sp.]|nr:hypothetical protein [Spirillospora sp.]